jgi:hypothetical protein
VIDGGVGVDSSSEGGVGARKRLGDRIRGEWGEGDRGGGESNGDGEPVREACSDIDHVHCCRCCCDGESTDGMVEIPSGDSSMCLFGCSGLLSRASSDDGGPGAIDSGDLPGDGSATVIWCVVPAAA